MSEQKELVDVTVEQRYRNGLTCCPEFLLTATWKCHSREDVEKAWAQLTGRDAPEEKDLSKWPERFHEQLRRERRRLQP